MSRERLEEVESLRVEMSARFQQGDQANSFTLDSEMALPDRVHGIFVVLGGREEFVGLGEDIYTAEPGESFLIDYQNLFRGDDFLMLLDRLLKPGVQELLTDLERAQEEGRRLYRIAFRTDVGEFIHRFFREEPTGRPVSARGELLIDGNSPLPHSFSIHCEGCVIQVGGDVDLVVEFALSAFNQPVVIPSPEDEPSLLSPPGSDDHGNASFSATPLFPGEGLTGVIDPRGDVDFFSFQAHAGEAYSILVILGTLRDSSVALRDIGGATELRFNDDYGEALGSRILWIAPRSGRYYAGVRGSQDERVGSYRIYVTTWKGKVLTPPDSAVRVTFLSEWGSFGEGDGQFKFPAEQVAVDASGEVYVTDGGNNRIQVFSSDGGFLRKWGTEGSDDGQLQGPAGIAVGATGEIYVVDTQNNRVQVFSRSGGFLRLWGTEGSGEGQFDFPSDVAVDALGEIYVTDWDNNRVQVFSREGTFLRQWGTEGSGDGEFRNPDGVAVDGKGRVHVTDKNNQRVQVFSASGEFLGKWDSSGSGEGQFISPHGINVDGSGNVYVADLGSNRVQVFGSDGTFLGGWGTEGKGDGEFRNPHGIVVDGSGTVYVTDLTNNRVQMFAVQVEAP